MSMKTLEWRNSNCGTRYLEDVDWSPTQAFGLRCNGANSQSFLTSRAIKVVLTGLASRSFHTDTGIPSSVFGSTLFLIFINALLDPIRWHNHLLLSYLQSKKSKKSITSNFSKKEPVLVFNWGKKWCVYFNASKTKLPLCITNEIFCLP